MFVRGFSLVFIVRDSEWKEMILLLNDNTRNNTT